MRAFTTEWRLQGLSVVEIAGAFEDLTRKLARKHKFSGRKLKPGPLLNALVLTYLEMSEADQERVTTQSLAKLEAFLAETDEEKQSAHQSIAAAGRTPKTGVQPPFAGSESKPLHPRTGETLVDQPSPPKRKRG